jgi:hypothetical protein
MWGHRQLWGRRQLSGIEWGGYSPYDPGVDRPLREVPRPVARAAFNRLMAAKAERIEELRSLLAANGVKLDDSDEGVQQLNDWFSAEVEPDRKSQRPRSIWYSVINDVSLFLGDTMIKRSPNLRWAFRDGGKRELSHQRHVIAGYTQVPNPKYYVDIDRVIATHGVRVIQQLEVDPRLFVLIIEESQEQA